MKNFVLLVLAGLVVFAIVKKRSSHAPRDTPVLAATGGGVQQREFMDLFDKDTAFADLAIAGRYTVVEVYLDTCGYCRELEAAFPRFQAKRPDITVVRVHHPGQIQLSFRSTRPEEQQKEAQRLNTKMQSYGLCGTPHVEIYGPNRQRIASDSCGKRSGTDYVWNWIAAETGVKRANGSSFSGF